MPQIVTDVRVPQNYLTQFLCFPFENAIIFYWKTNWWRNNFCFVFLLSQFVLSWDLLTNFCQPQIQINGSSFKTNFKGCTKNDLISLYYLWFSKQICYQRKEKIIHNFMLDSWLDVFWKDNPAKKHPEIWFENFLLNQQSNVHNVYIV